ncbi:hypothetical protein QTP70_010747 [Hemibagrus guttatus]|uniref:Alkylated DNA repair protein AlkB homologue 8 N-terminal domain-containing protein n=1 Tax=Hemibagrus guttatus TaxID=175788 RepID=A0AAE0PXA2_9TELE|nr:hypothetical protein QTP70_010747 [Hemibagrus guttatus]
MSFSAPLPPRLDKVNTKTPLSHFQCDGTPCHEDEVHISYVSGVRTYGTKRPQSRDRVEDERIVREEIQSLSAWCSINNFTLNATKTKELIVDVQKCNSSRHSPIYINGSEVEHVSSFKFLGIHISEDLSWRLNTSTLVRKTQQRLYFQRIQFLTIIIIIIIIIITSVSGTKQDQQKNRSLLRTKWRRALL